MDRCPSHGPEHCDGPSPLGRMKKPPNASRSAGGLCFTLTIIMAKPGPKTSWQDTARYRRRRCPERLRPQEVAELFNADAFARWRAAPLNVFITIAFVHTAAGDAEANKTFARLRDCVGKSFARWGGEYSGLYVFEAKGGLHVHWAAHCPPSILPQFDQLLHRQLRPRSAAAILIRQRWRGERDRLMRYLVKGTDWVTARRVKAWAMRQGIVDFKRCGISQSIGKAARRRAGFEQE